MTIRPRNLEPKEYLILTTNVLRNDEYFDGTLTFHDQYSPLRYDPVQGRPVNYNERIKAFTFRKTIKTNKPLTNIISQFREVSRGEILIVLHDESIEALSIDIVYWNNDSKSWETAAFDELADDSSLTDKQIKYIHDKLETFYDKFMENPKEIEHLQAEYLSWY
jgi:hypothetical protein